MTATQRSSSKESFVVALERSSMEKFRVGKSDKLELCELALPKKVVADDDYGYFIYERHEKETTLLDAVFDLVKTRDSTAIMKLLDKCFDAIVALKSPPVLFCPSEVIVSNKELGKISLRINSLALSTDEIKVTRQCLKKHVFGWPETPSQNSRLSWTQGFSRFVWLITEGHYFLPDDDSPFASLTGDGAKKSTHHESTSKLYLLLTTTSLDIQTTEDLWRETALLVEKSLRSQLESSQEEILKRLEVYRILLLCEEYLHRESFMKQRVTQMSMSMHMLDFAAANSVNLLELQSLLSVVDFEIQKCLPSVVASIQHSAVSYTVDHGSKLE